MEEAVSLKDQANALFAKKEYKEALKLYDAALVAVVKDTGGNEKKDLHCTLLTNRATCFMQLKLYAECVEGCDAALKLDGRRTKTLYRRAQAYEEMGKLEEALKDLRVCVQLEPANKPAILAARRVRDALTKEMQGRTPVYQMLEVLRDPLSDVKVLQAALHSLIGLTTDSVGAALEVKARGGLPLLWSMIQQDSQALDAVHVLAACCNHAAFVGKAFDSTSGETSLTLKELQGLTRSADIGTAKAAVVLMLRIAKHWQIEPAGHPPEEVVKAFIGAWTGALAHDKREVRMAGMEALVTWLSTRMDEKNGSEEVVHALEGDMLRQLVSCLDACWKRSLLDCKDQGERQKAALALGRLWALLRGSPEKIKQLFLELVPEKGKSSTDGFDLSTAERTLLLITGLAYADNALAIWALEDASKDEKAIADTKNSTDEADGRAHIHTVFLLIMAPVESSQEIAVELVNLVVSTDGGRSLFGSLVSSDVFIGLLKSPNPTVKAAAASAYTKQGLAAKALTSDSQEVTQLLNVAADELRRAPLPPPQQKKPTPPTTKISDDKQKEDGRSLERAMEVLSCLVTRTSLKDEITFGSGRCVATLPLLLEKARDGRSSSAYGLSFILASITLSNEQLRDEALAERDMTKEQYEQLQSLQKIQTPDGKEVNKDALEAEADPPQRVQKRVQELVRLGGIRALCRLADGAGLSTQEQIAMAFAEVATVEEARGSMLQQGGFNTCMELATEAHPEKTRTRAIHAIAKCLVTTNPHVLSERQRMNPIPPMLWLCRQSSASNLQQFECLLGLTNLASAGDEVRNAIAANKGVGAIQYLQYSEHPMVRRAATEALCNMATHPDGIANFRNVEKLKIWLALADDYEGEPATAQAAMGALATAAADEGVSEALTADEVDGIERIKSILSSGVVNMVYRAAVCVGYMIGFEKSRAKLLSKDMLKCLKSLHLKQVPEEVDSAVRFAIDALEQGPSQT